MTFSKLRVGITICLVLALLVVGWLYREEIKESAELAQTVLQQNSDLKEMEEELERSEKLRKKSEEIARNHSKKLKNISQETRRLKNEIFELEIKDREVATWSNTSVPSTIFDILCDSSSTNKNSDSLCTPSPCIPDEVPSAENKGE